MNARLAALPGVLATRLRSWWSETLFPVKRPASTGYDRWFWLGLLLLAPVTACLLFTHLHYPLVEPDEGRYAEIPREMLRSGNWLVPTLNHERYYDKPPLLYWLVALSLRTFGVHDWATRLPPACAALLTILATFFFARRLLGSRAAFLGALALGLMTGFMQCGRFLVLDSVLTLFVAVSLFAGYEAVHGTRFRWSWWVVSALFCALGVLTKGPVALVLFVPPVALFGWLHRDTARPRLGRWLAYAGLLFALASPWFVAVSVHDPDFAYQFFVQHHLKRFFGEEYHDSPFWFYVPVLLIGCLPWSTLLVSFTKFLFSRSADVRGHRLRGMGFLLLWAGWCVFFFSLSRGKLPPYILPALPAIALLVGYTLEKALFEPSLAPFFQLARTLAPRSGALILCAGLAAANVWAFTRGSINPSQCWQSVLEISVAVAGIVALVVWGRKLAPKAAWGICCILTFGVLLEMGCELVPAWAALRSPVSEAARIEQLLSEGHTGVLCHGEEWGSVAFFVDRDEIYLNSKSRSVEEMKEFLGAHRRALIVMKADGDKTIFPRAIPAGMEVAKVLHSGQAHIYLLRHISQSADQAVLARLP